MARHKEFEPEKALAKAMQLFWEQGYNATSVGDLVNATGVQRYGLYSTFGDKHTLFLKSLDYYLDTMVTMMLQGLETDEASWTAIEDFFGILKMTSREPTAKVGCLMCNSATELGAHDPNVAQRMQRYQTRLQVAFEKGLIASQEDGILGPGLDPKSAAGFVVGVIIGFFALIKTEMSRDDIDNYLDTALQGIKGISFL